MKITLVLIGKTKEAYLQEGIAEYVKRLGRYCPFNIHLIPDVKSGKKSSEAYIKQQEGLQILNFLKPGDHMILLDEKGKSYSSVKFARKIQELESSTRHLVFVIGGAYGFSEDVYRAAREKMSLSEMTFSHQMVRLIFTEQLYRAFTILKGEPYHHQ